MPAINRPPSDCRYFIPPAGMTADELNVAELVATNLARLVQFNGSADAPLKHVHLSNVTLAHAAYTYLEPYVYYILSASYIHAGD